LTRYFESRTLQAAGLVLIVLILAAPAYRNLGQYSDFYDGGVYLESARMLAAGYAPYRAVFISQPPAWLKLIQWSFALFGQNMRAGQLFTVSTLVLTALAVAFILLDRDFWLGAVLACVTLLMSPLAFFWAREITGELPSAVFAAVSLTLAGRYASGGRRLWLVAGALALAGAMMVKLFGVYALPSVLLIAAGRWGSAGQLRQRIGYAAADILLVLGITFATVLAMASAYGGRDVWTQAVAFHLGSRADLSPARNSGLIVATLARDPVLSSALPLVLCAALEPWIGWAALGWLILTLIGLLLQHPLFTHHVVALIPPLALAAGIGVGALWKLGRRLQVREASVRSNDYGWAMGIALCSASIILFAAVCRGGLAGRTDQQWILAYWRPPAADLHVAAELARLTGKADFILTDAPGIAFWSGREVPPWLADTSLKRIDNHYLATAEVKSEVERYQVKAVLLWTGRLDRLPGLTAWLEQTFPTRRRYGAQGVLYLRP
jgi:4-amino-4-deoxy-L-arabinose transferase-like glycosyltransferase